MNHAIYSTAEEMAYPWVNTSMPYPIHADQLKQLSGGVGIYFACRADGQLLYIGSCIRPQYSKGIARRIAEHPASRRARWWWFWVLPLRDNTPPVFVRSLEGKLIFQFQPVLNDRQPSMYVSKYH
jgi:hypothetical protein